MHLHAEAFLRLSRPACDDDERRFLGVGARDRVEQVQPAGAVGDDAHAEAVGDARGAVGREADGGLVAQRDELEPPVLRQRFVQVEHKIAGNAEDVPNALCVDLVEENLMELHSEDYRTLQTPGVFPPVSPAVLIIGYANTKLAVTKRIAGIWSFNAMALGPGLVLAEVAGSSFCPLSLSRRLLSFAQPTLSTAGAAGSESVGVVVWCGGGR